MRAQIIAYESSKGWIVSYGYRSFTEDQIREHDFAEKNRLTPDQAEEIREKLRAAKRR